jgi:hypothetical protein
MPPDLIITGGARSVYGSARVIFMRRAGVAHRSDVPPLYGRSASPTAATRSASSCPVIASWAPPVTPPATAVEWNASSTCSTLSGLPSASLKVAGRRSCLSLCGSPLHSCGPHHEMSV